MSKPIKCCQVDDCTEKCHGLGYCSKHYRRFKKYNNPLVVVRKLVRGSIEDRFWPRIDKTPYCWLWTGATTTPKPTTKVKYGVLGRGGRGSGNIRAHVASWIIHFGPIPEGLLVRHKCDIGTCVNPDHLELGTQKDNMQDASKRGRIRNQYSES